VGRLGGDELLVVLRNIHTAADAMDVAHKIHQACQRPVLYQRTSIAISVSIGVGLAQPGDSPAALQIRADQALYSAKEQGRNRVIQVKSALP
jgi:diguanylate cyclase (GGDEF)-like protein